MTKTKLRIALAATILALAAASVPDSASAVRYGYDVGSIDFGGWGLLGCC